MSNIELGPIENSVPIRGKIKVGKDEIVFDENVDVLAALDVLVK